ncbi:MAG: four helix bundle protein [bacterium]
MALAKSFRELDVYQLALTQSKKIFLLTQRFPRDEKFSLSGQIRRSSRAVNALVAESWARRIYRAAFVNKIDEALGEAMETQAWLDHALSCEYLDPAQHREADEAWQHIGAMLMRMMQEADSFCKMAVKK